MTTIETTPRAGTEVIYRVTLTSPLHHGAGSAGNTSVLRTQDVIQPDGTSARVPFVSAASIRHGLRDALAWHAARFFGWQQGTLTKTLADLLWSGGAVTSTGAAVDLGLGRRVDDTFPGLGLLGYAARSSIVEGTLRASDLILACRENAWRIPEGIAPEHVLTKGAGAFRGEEFGTRHDIAGGPVAQLIADADEAIGKTMQMIYDTQVLVAGSVLVGEFGLRPSATKNQRAAFDAALALWSAGGRVRLAAKTGRGYGTGTVTMPGSSWGEEAIREYETILSTAGSEAVISLLHDVAG